jgi:hypothetical protein
VEGVELAVRLIEEHLHAPAVVVRGVKQLPLDVIHLDAFTEVASVIATKCWVTTHARILVKNCVSGDGKADLITELAGGPPGLDGRLPARHAGW